MPTARGAAKRWGKRYRCRLPRACPCRWGMGARCPRGARWRSRWRQRPYGDQGLLIERRWYDQVGGIRPLPLMEDLEFAARFACTGRFQALALAIRVDGRRWQRLGLVGTTWANAALRRAWRRGAPAASLYGEYQNAQRWPWGSSSQP